MYGFALIAILAVMGGAIAYIGDRIGMKVGRKRLSIFGLRPKYTSIIVTIITGVVVAASTLVVLSIVSNDVRTALFRMKEIQVALAQTRTSLNEAMSDLNTIKTEYDSVKAEYDRVKADYDNVVSQRDAAVAEKEKAEAERARALAEYEKAKQDFDRVSKEYAEISEEYQAARSRLEEAQKSLSSAEAKIAELTRTKKSLDEEVARLTQQRDGLEKQKSDLEKQRSALVREVADLQNKVDTLQSQVGILEKQVTNLETQRDALVSILENTKVSDVVLKAKEIILATVIDASQPDDKVWADLQAFLLKANDKLLKKGLKTKESDDEAFYPVNPNFQEAVQKLNEADGRVVVRLVSMTNTWRGEPAYGWLEVLEDKRIYEAGDVIAQRVIDSSRGPDAVQEELLSLLVDVRLAAVEKGMVTDENGNIGGAITSTELGNLKSEVLLSGGKVRVVARAGKDIWRTTEAPDIDFSVEK